METAVRDFVRQRANGQCEYCGLAQDAAPYFVFHVEHIRARQHGGGDELSNSAFACPDCKAKKGPNVASVSALTGNLVELFNPRQHVWQEHFANMGAEIIGITEIGRATVQLLDMNEIERVAMRAQLQSERFS
jgi:hypothetical protein